MTYNGGEMFGVPTWAELRLDASELANLQRDCYREIHGMLDINIPEIDRKLSILSDKKLEETKGTKLAEVTKPKPISIEKSKSVDVDNYSGPASKSKHKTWTTSIPKLVGSTKPISNGDAKNATFARKSRSPNSKNLEAVNDERDSRKTSITQPKQLDYSKQADETDYLHDTTMMWRSLNYNDYEHLRPLPMPLGYYLKINRPEMIWEADRRVSYLKKKAEKRRVLTAERTLNALDQIRISSRASSNKRSPSTRSSMVRTMSRDSMPPNYQVKYNFSEQEMKRLTAKIYNRLPEVKKQRNQEVNKHLKVQNYKNKLDYGRKLVENRRRGIINYPLKSHYEESSIMSSLGDESLTNSLDRSAEGIRFESYY